MSEKLRESLSALLDDEANELEVQRLMTQVSDDQQLRQTWVRYNLARDALAGHSMDAKQIDISASVMAALAEETSASAGGWKQRVLRPVGSLAVAASVAATVVIGGQQLAGLDADSYGQGGQAVAASASPVGLVNSFGATSVQASYGNQAVPALQPATHTAYRELARQRMNKYMQEHVEHAALNTPQGLIPFARVPEIRE